jgi:hypothetical protein
VVLLFNSLQIFNSYRAVLYSTFLYNSRVPLSLFQLNNHVASNFKQGQGLRSCQNSRIRHIWLVVVNFQRRCSRRTSDQLSFSYASLGIAELLIFHPVDTVAKRLMSNKAKVTQVSPKPKYPESHRVGFRCPSRRYHPLSSGTTHRRPLPASSCLCSLG